MDKKKYTETQNTILRVGKEVRFLRLDLFVDAINTAEAVAPITDPTMYRAAMKNLRIVKKMAESLMDFQNNLPEFSAILDGLKDADHYNNTHTGL